MSNPAIATSIAKAAVRARVPVGVRRGTTSASSFQLFMASFDSLCSIEAAAGLKGSENEILSCFLRSSNLISMSGSNLQGSVAGPAGHVAIASGAPDS